MKNHLITCIVLLVFQGHPASSKDSNDGNSADNGKASLSGENRGNASSLSCSKAAPYQIPEPTRVSHGGWDVYKHSIEKEFQRRVLNSWYPSNEKLEATVKCILGGDGLLYDIEISSSSGDNQFDVECLEAVLGADYFYQGLSSRRLVPLSVTFRAAEHKQFGRTTENYFKRNPEQKGEGCLAIYHIPTNILKRYPGLFTEKELLDDSNLYLVKDAANHNENPQYHWLKDLYKNFWTTFFQQHPKATKDEVLAQAAMITR
jgi:hypothetical protein